MDLNTIYANLMYDLVVDDKYKYHGNIDYVSHHFADGTTSSCTVTVSKQQTPELQPIVNEYFEALATEPGLSIDEFLKRKTI